MGRSEKVTCSFVVDREIYDTYKSIVTESGRYVKGDLVAHMKDVIERGSIYRSQETQATAAQKKQQ